MGKARNSSNKPVDKHADFLRVVTPRVNKAMKAIELLGNQAGAAYAPTEHEVSDMFAALRQKVDDTEAKFLDKKFTSTDFKFGKKP